MEQQLKKLYRRALCGLTCAIIVLSSLARADTLVEQDFNQQDGALVSNEDSKWEHRSGTEGDLLVQDGQLLVTSSATEDASAYLSDQSYDAESTVTLFASFKLTVTKNPSSGGGYFAHFRGGSSATFRGRLFIAGAEEGDGFRLGISNGGSSFSDSTMLDATLELNRSYRIVMSYQPSTATTRLGVDPTSEDDLVLVATDEASVRTINQFAIRQTSGIGQMQMDDLKVTTEFSELTAILLPKKATINIQNITKTLPERGGFSLSVVMERTGVLDTALVVPIQWSGTAKSGDDYIGRVDQIHFEPGQHESEFSLEIIDDFLKEGPETMVMSIVESDAFEISGNGAISWTIADDDLTTVRFLPQELTMVKEGVHQEVKVSLERRGNTQSNLAFQLKLGGTAERGTDFELSFPLSSVFESDQDQVELLIQILDDDLVEIEENLTLSVVESPEFQIESGEVEISIMSNEFSGLLLEETFDYTDGPLTEVSSNSWHHSSGKENEIRTFAGQLDVNELQSEDVYVRFPLPVLDDPDLPEELFIGMDVFFANAPDGEGAYWAHLRGGNSSSYRARLFVRRPAVEENKIELGISNGSSNADVWFPEVFDVPSRLRVVMGFRLRESITRLWINPVTQLDSLVEASDEVSTSQLNAFAIRQPGRLVGGMGRLLLDHLVISTHFADAVMGSDKPVLFWEYRSDSLELVDSLPSLSDPIHTTRSYWSESTPRSRDLYLRRLESGETEILGQFEVGGNVVGGSDLNISPGFDPILIPKGQSEGMIQFTPIQDREEEEDEFLQLKLVPDDAYQLGYPSVAIFALADAPFSPTLNLDPINLFIVAKTSPGDVDIDLSLEGSVHQKYLLEMSNDLVHWELVQSGVFEDSTSIRVDIDPDLLGSKKFFRAAYNTIEE